MSRRVDADARCSAACGRWSSTRSTRSPATTAAGTCWPCSSGSTQLAGRELQRIGLSATVGNPDGLLDWLVCGGARRAATVVLVAAAGGGRARRHARLRRERSTTPPR